MNYRRLAGAWMLVILALMSIPGRDLPHVELQWADKLVHAGLFFVLGWLWLRGQPAVRPRAIAATLALGAAYALATELYQLLMPIGRSFDVFDALADVAGVALATALGAARQAKKDRQKGNQAPSTVS